MEEKEPFFMSIEDAHLDEMAASRHGESHPQGLGQELPDEDCDDPHPELFYLACKKALVRLKRYATTSPSF